jgi:1-acyl-sn-glycerol-3-phosphate acyltransferase
MFPEGTRTRDGNIGKGRGGAGLLILETHPTVIPVCIDGMSQVLPVGARFPRFFQQVVVRYGEPLDLSEFYAEKKSKEVAQAIMDRVMDSIRALRANGKAAP